MDNPKEEPLPAKNDSTKSAENMETDKPTPEVAIFGFKAETASYKKGTEGKPDTLEFGGVDEQVTSPDGKNQAEMLKIVESNLFPEKVIIPPSELKEAKETPAQKAHAWLVWLDDKQAEISLSNPIYSAGARTMKFDIEIIGGVLHEGSLGKVELKLQDCPDNTYVCAKSTLTACNNEIGPVGTCWNWLALNCLPCHCDSDMKECVEKNPDCCDKADEPCYPSRLGPHGWERYCL